MSIVVTGIGVVAPNGTRVDAFWDGLLVPATTPAHPRSMPERGVVCAEIQDESWRERLPVGEAALDRNAQLAVVAAGEALGMAGLDGTNAEPSRVAVVIGNGAGGQVSMDAQFARLYREGALRAHPMTIAKSMVSSSASWVSMAYGLTGPSFVVASACASGTHAIGIAAGLLRAGLVDVAVAGGTEAPLAEGTIRAWSAMRILSPDVCRPFSRDRRGLILGEGSGMLVLEREAHARARGGAAIARFAGFASCSDAGDLFAPSAQGMARAMREALADGGLSASDIDYINAHGTGTAANDATETQALKAVFGASSCPPVSSIKAVTGHGLGAAGGIEAVASVLALSRGALPPTANHAGADADCDLDYVPNTAREARPRAVLSNSFAFGGLNASLAFTAA